MRNIIFTFVLSSVVISGSVCAASTFSKTWPDFVKKWEGAPLLTYPERILGAVVWIFGTILSFGRP